MGLHKTQGNLEVAKRENEAVLYEDDYQNKYNMGLNTDEAQIILSMYQNLHLEQSARFAQLCQEQFHGRAGRADKGVKQAGFLVLWKTSMPSVLIESGFLSSPAEERFLGSDKGQTHMAASIFRAFRTWRDEIEGTTKTYDDAIEKMASYKPGSEDTAGLRKPVNYIANPNAKNTTAKADTAGTKPKTDSAPAKKDPLIHKTDSVKVNYSMKAVYRVQIVSSEKAIAAGSSQFKGVSDTWHYEQGGMHKYTAGSYLSQSEAVKRQSELRKLGFDQAFVVAFDDKGKRITLEDAKKMNGK